MVSRSRAGDADVPHRWNPVHRVDSTYYTLLERSGEFVVAAADALHELFSGPVIDAAAFAALDEVEHRADSNTHDLFARLERGHTPPFPEPITRRLITEIDEIVDHAETAGELAVLTGVGQATLIAVEMTEVLSRTAREVASLLTYLESSDGFRPYVARIHELENEGDALWTRGFRALFAGEADPITVLKWKEIYQALENAIDSCESSARLIEQAVTHR
jgi:uncharacterized protein Yka (UPF0111/DUF47 family)